MSDYDPVKCLPRGSGPQSASMPVTGFYIQAAAVLAEHKKQKERIAELERENAELQQEHDFLMKWFEKHGTKAHHSVFEVFDDVEVERDQLRKENAELKAENTRLSDHVMSLSEPLKASEPKLREELEKPLLLRPSEVVTDINPGRASNAEALILERDQTRLQVVRLREALEFIGGKTDHGHRDEPCPICLAVDNALAETPSQSSKEVLGTAVELLRMACDDGEGNLDRAKKLGEDISKFHPTVPLYRKEIARLKRLFE